MSVGTHKMDMWAEAEKCRTSKGTKTGETVVEITTSGVSVDIEVESGYVLEEAAMWIGKDKLPQKGHSYTSSPDHFPYKTERDGVHRFKFRYGKPHSVYFAMYAEVCETEEEETPAPTPVPVPTTTEPECVTAWAKGKKATCFKGMKNCWRDDSGVLGWTNQVRLGTESMDLLAGAKSCDGKHTTEVGEVEIDIDRHGWK